MNIRVLLLTTLALPIFARPALGVVVLNSSDSTALAAPANGSPWDYVARLDDGFGARASGVYLGNRYILTANHVDNDINLVHLDNADFTIDGSFTPVAITGTDMRIIRLAQDPGLAMMPLIGSGDSAFNQPATMIGYGVGKGTVVPNQGWNWGDDTTRLKRWATNTTLGSYFLDQNNTPYLQTSFDLAVGGQEGQLTGGDSGGGLFINFGGVWKLAGINADVDTDGQALYDHSPAIAGNQADRSYFASVLQFTNQIDAIIGAAPIGGAVQFWDGTGPANDGTISGGNGSWNATATNWTSSTGTSNAKWQNGTATFGGPGGTVILTSALSAQALIFNSSGYAIAGTSVLTLAGAAPEIDVTNAGDSATIGVPLAGTAGLKVGGAGTLILANATNSYTGSTTVGTATLQIGTATVAGKISASSAVTLNQGGTLSLVNLSGNIFANNVTTGTGGGTLNIGSANTLTLSGALTDDGTNSLALIQSGAGTTIITNAHNTYSAATTVTAGTLQIGTATAPGSIGVNSAVSLLNNSTFTLVNVSGNALVNDIDHASGGSSLVNVNSAQTVTLSGQLSNSTGLLSVALSGTGALVLNNPANSYAGGTTLNSGILVANGNPVDGSGTPLGTGTLTIKGGTLGTSLVPSTSGAISTLPNAISLLGNFSLGTVSVPAYPGLQNFLLNGNIDLNGATRTITGIINMGQPQFGGAIGAVGETAGVNFNTTFTKAGDYVAFIFTPTNVNNYTGLTTVNNGAILVFEGITANGAIRGNLDIEGNGVVDYIYGPGSPAQIADSATVTVNSSGNTLSGGTHFAGFDLRGADETIATLLGHGTVGLGSGTLTLGGGNFTGIIQDGAFGMGGSLVMDNASGTLILSGKNTYTGATDIDAGILQAGAAGTVPITSAVDVNTGAKFDLHNFIQSVGSIADGASGGGTITLGSATLTTGSDGSSTTFSGVIQNTGGLIKVGAGTLTLSGVNTYTGVTNVTAGTLQIDGSLAAASTVNVGTAGTLAGSGRINGKATLAGNGTINLNGGTIAGTLAVTGGQWNGSGTVGGVITASANAFSINGTLHAPAGLAVTGGTLSGSGVLDGSLTYTSSSNSTLGATISGATSKVIMNKVGATLILTGTDTYGGTTTVSAGTLQMGDGVNGLLSSTSGITVAGTGIFAMNLPGTSSYNIPINLSAAGATLKAIQAGTTTLDSTVSGLGIFSQSGLGTTILTAANTYTGATNVTAGTLEVDGSLSAKSTVNVATAGTLTGTGVIGGNATLTGNGFINFGSNGTILGTLAATGGNWNGVGAVNGLVTVTANTFHLNGSLTAPVGLTVSGGTLTGVGTLTGPLNYTSSLSSSFAGVNAGTGTLTMNKAGATLTLTGDNTYTGATKVLAGTLQVGNGTTGNLSGTSGVTVSGTGILATDFADQSTFAQNINLIAAGASIKAIQPGLNTFSGVISGSGIFNQSGPGDTVLAATETYTGPTNVTAGTLEVQGSLAAASVVNIGTGGTLGGGGTINGRATMTGNANSNFFGTIVGTLGITGGNWNGQGTVGGLVTSSSGTFHLNQTLTATKGLAVTGGSLAGSGTLNGNLTYTSSASSTFGGVISDGATSSSLVMNNAAATLTLLGPSTYTGGTTIAAGTVVLAGSSAPGPLGYGGVTIKSGATLALNFPQGTSFANNITNNGRMTDSAATGPHYLTGTITGTGTFTKTGGSAVTLSGANTYSGGTTINGGTLVANNTSGLATGTGKVTVNSGAILGGTGTTGAITLNNSGLIAPSTGGNGTSSTLHASSLLWNGGGKLELALSSFTSDTLSLSGALTKGTSGSFVLALDDLSIQQTSYTLLTFASTNFSLSDFTLELPDGYTGSLVETSTSLSVDLTPVQSSAANFSGGTLSFGNGPLTLPQTRTMNSDLATLTVSPGFVAAPEPGSFALLVLGAGPLLGWRRRRVR